MGGLHQGLEVRLQTLSIRIAELKTKMADAMGMEKLALLFEIADLERRHAALQIRLLRLDLEGPGIRQAIKAEFAEVADDLRSAIDNFMTRVDSAYQASLRRTPRGKA